MLKYVMVLNTYLINFHLKIYYNFGIAGRLCWATGYTPAREVIKEGDHKSRSLNSTKN